ncbi:MAG TPA: ATP-binding protein [Solirubrobacteraceae bacterium]|nr:ATP-binding protein [Solirubrobacteraceae bacterium]
MADKPNVILTLPSRPENVLVVRQALTGLAEGLALDAVDTNDLNTAVTEACNNVVLHAYAGRDGGGAPAQADGGGGERDGEPLEVEVTALEREISVVVRDRGVGMRPSERLEEDEEQRGMGLAVIAALTSQVEFADVPGGGTEVRMRFARARPGRPLEADAPAAGSANGAAILAPLRGSVQLQLAPGSLARAVLPRVLCALAARAYFTVDRISDVQLIAAAIAENAPGSLDGTHLAVAVNVAPRNLDLRIGPLHAGRGQSVLSAAADGLAPVIERLTDVRRVAPLGAGESLELALVDRR